MSRNWKCFVNLVRFVYSEVEGADDPPQVSLAFVLFSLV